MNEERFVEDVFVNDDEEPPLFDDDPAFGLATFTPTRMACITCPPWVFLCHHETPEYVLLLHTDSGGDVDHVTKLYVCFCQEPDVTNHEQHGWVYISPQPPSLRSYHLAQDAYFARLEQGNP